MTECRDSLAIAAPYTGIVRQIVRTSAFMSRQNQDTVISGSKMYVVLSGEVEIQLKGRQSCIPMMVSISAAQHIPSSKLKAMPPNRLATPCFT
jgi:hypothetical protein